MDRTTRTTSLLAVAGIAVILAGCGASGNSSAPSSEASMAAASQPAASEEAGASPKAYVVTVSQVSLGSILTGGDGMTLYLLTKDSAGTSTCTGNCATTWPPFTLKAGDTVSAGSGVSGTISTIKRPDGSDQVAINGLPLYYYSGDSAAGDTMGQGTNGVWFVAGPDGSGVGAPGASESPASSGSGGYY